MKDRKPIGRKDAQKLVVTLYLNKDEKKIVDRVSARFRGHGRVRSGVGQAIAFLIRVAVECFRDHATQTPDPEAVTVDEAVGLGIDFHDGFGVETPKQVAKREAREWRRKNPPNPITRLR